VYQENLGPIYRYVYSHVGDRHEAEDLTSQIFLKAVHSLDLRRSALRGHTWLLQVARTTIADYWRAYYHVSTSSQDELLEAGWEGPVEEELAAINIEAADRVQHLLQAVPERDREVLTCRFLLDLSIKATALRMGVTVANVKALQFRALKYAADLERVGTQQQGRAL
jgi:RNA polymerase sigma-70 factor, ECF subfamily